MPEVGREELTPAARAVSKKERKLKEIKPKPELGKAALPEADKVIADALLQTSKALDFGRKSHEAARVRVEELRDLTELTKLKETASLADRVFRGILDPSHKSDQEINEAIRAEVWWELRERKRSERLIETIKSRFGKRVSLPEDFKEKFKTGLEKTKSLRDQIYRSKSEHKDLVERLVEKELENPQDFFTQTVSSQKRKLTDFSQELSSLKREIVGAYSQFYQAFQGARLDSTNFRRWFARCRL